MQFNTLGNIRPRFESRCRHAKTGKWVPEAPAAGVKRLEPEAHHSPDSNAEVNNTRSWPPTPQTSLLAVHDHRDTFSLIIHLPGNTIFRSTASHCCYSMIRPCPWRFTKHHAIKAYWGVEVYFHIFLSYMEACR